MLQNDERLYELVATEISSKEINVGLWTKAYATARGDENATRALYIKLRVRQLREQELAALKVEYELVKEEQRIVKAQHRLSQKQARERRKQSKKAICSSCGRANSRRRPRCKSCLPVLVQDE